MCAPATLFLQVQERFFLQEQALLYKHDALQPAESANHWHGIAKTKGIAL
jgi:hypothetical protein